MKWKNLNFVTTLEVSAAFWIEQPSFYERIAGFEPKTLRLDKKPMRKGYQFLSAK